MFDVIEVALGSAVAQNGTIVIAYPAGRYSGSYVGYGHSMYARGLQKWFSQDDGNISVAFTTVITITYKGATSIPASTIVSVQINRAGDESVNLLAGLPEGVTPMLPYLIDLGTPIAADVDGVCAAQARTGAGALLINGSGNIVNGECILDVPRALTYDSGGTNDAVITVTGEDVYDNVMVESKTLNDQSVVAGTKAFKKVTGVHASKTIDTSVFVGFGDVLGLPVFLPAATAIGTVIGDYENGTFDATLDGAIVAGVQLTPTATTGDVRGTFDGGAAADGAVNFKVQVFLTDPTYKGVNQYAG